MYACHESLVNSGRGRAGRSHGCRIAESTRGAGPSDPGRVNEAARAAAARAACRLSLTKRAKRKRLTATISAKRPPEITMRTTENQDSPTGSWACLLRADLK